MKQSTLLLAMAFGCLMPSSYVSADDSVKGKSLRATMLNKGKNFSKRAAESGLTRTIEV